MRSIATRMTPTRILIRTEVGSQNYPPDLQTLVDGVSTSGGGGGAGGISASALAGASGTGQFGSAGTPQFGPGAGKRDAAIRLGDGYWRGGGHPVAGVKRHCRPSHVGLNQQSALPKENSGGPHDRETRLGSARRAGRSGFRQLGRAQCLRRIFSIPGDGGRRNEIFRLVARMNSFHITAFCSGNMRRRSPSARRALCGRILAARNDDRHHDYFDPGGHRGGKV